MSIAAAAVAALGILLAACSTADPTPTPGAGSVSQAPSATPAPTPTPSPTPEPTPRYQNQHDEELAALIPTSAAGATIVVAPFDEFALTPGDVAIAFGDIGDRFSSLVLAYVGQPRTSLYAMRVDGDPVTTDDLEPHLATAGRYVGIAGLDPDPWEAAVVGGNQVWTRPEDNATAAGTHIYTWSSGEFVFLLIGVDDAVNRAIIEQLPGEPAPTPSPVPTTRSGAPSVAPSVSPSG
ncbi:MAG TPA: hypothetical protein VFW95_13700 [Candidatus Limnocylindria bacterium]|nr:hypothetical protein [Candidatus Limnocylindria bacterium]